MSAPTAPLMHVEPVTDSQNIVEPDAQEVERWRRKKKFFSPLTGDRPNCLIMAFFVTGLHVITAVPYTYNYDPLFRREVGAIIDICIFYTLMILSLTSYFQCVYTCAGTPPLEWEDIVSALPENSDTRQKCAYDAQTGRFRPPRAHRDRMSRRTILNLDHFCPWVANSVGFYNRKFFILFILYAGLASCYAVIVGFMLHNPNINDNVFLLAVLVFDCFLGFMLTQFGLIHIIMASNNQTTIEYGKRAQIYNIGRRRNLESVFGKNPYFWPIPLYFSGPVGNGINWPTRNFQEEV